MYAMVKIGVNMGFDKTFDLSGLLEGTAERSHEESTLFLWTVIRFGLYQI